jgi:hypothetical protein
MPSLHRNNAAEWSMIAVAWPFAMVVRLIDCIRNRARGA